MLSARLLFANGQTTERMVAAVEQLADALGVQATVFPRWGELTVRIDDDTGSRYEIIAIEPLGVDMSKVAATVGVIDKVCDRYQFDQRRDSAGVVPVEVSGEQVVDLFQTCLLGRRVDSFGVPVIR